MSDLMKERALNLALQIIPAAVVFAEEVEHVNDLRQKASAIILDLLKENERCKHCEARAARQFPIMRSYGRSDADEAGCPDSIPWALIEPHGKQAFQNHSQSLERLAERGGLSACEAVAVLGNRRWREMKPAESSARLRELLNQFEHK